jgi:hypothetical protein
MGRPPTASVALEGSTPRRVRTMQASAALLCARCGEAADGWKCAICGAVAREHDPGHLHVGSDRYCTLRCAACGRADVHCGCV